MNVCYVQAFFGVFDGHGGQEAVDFAADNLGRNIIEAMKEAREEDDEDSLETATKVGYKTTDNEFLAQVCTSHLLRINNYHI